MREKGAPAGLFRLAEEMHVCLRGQFVRFAGIAANAGTDDIFPGGFAAFLSRNDMIKIQIVVFEAFPAVLAGEFIALEDRLPTEFDILFREPVIMVENNDRRYANLMGDRVQDIITGVGSGKSYPRGSIVSLESGFRIGVDDLRMPNGKQADGPLDATNIHRLPEPVQHQNLTCE